MKQIKLTVPQNWSQVSSDQLKQYARLSLLELATDSRLAMIAINWAGYRIKVDAASIDNNDIIVQNNDKEFRLVNHQVMALIEAVRWTTDDIKGIKAPNFKFKSPNSQLYGTTLQQFLIADGAYLAFSARRDPKMLKILAATYYGRFNAKLISTKVKTMKFKPYELMAIYLWFTSVKRFMIDKYAYLYPENKGDSQPNSVNMKQVALDMLSVLNNGCIEKNQEIMKKGEIHSAMM
nr:hypothetical protein [Bacteroidales bacterium]